MQTIVGSSIEEYLYKLLPERDEVLAKMENEAKRRNIPIVGPLVGRYLYQLAVIHKAKRVYEMGSAIGYSTIWWARGVGPGGEVHYTDGNRQSADEAQTYFRESGISWTKTHVGNALEILDSISGEFDVIFCDIDKGDYPEAFQKAIPRLRKGGLFVADNVLWGGRVAEENPDEWTTAIRKFNELLYKSPGLYTTIVPLRDGVSVTLKL